MRSSRQIKPPRAPKRAAVLLPRVVMMAKAPVLGLVKTRLGREIGPAQATRLYRATATAVIGRLKRDYRFELRLAMAPDAAIVTRGFDGRIPRQKQGRGDIGARMLRAAAHAPPGPVLIIGTDIPSIRSAHVVDAFRRLRDAAVVLGPAEDGGFWLIGFRRFPSRVPIDCFTGVRWSSEHALADVVANLRNKRIAYAATLSDIDSAADIRRLSASLGRRILGSAEK